MKQGSIVETMVNFETERRQWGLPYPCKGQVLTVSAATPHPCPEVRAAGIVLLHFEEIPQLFGVCDKTINGKDNFVELILSEEIASILNEVEAEIK